MAYRAIERVTYQDASGRTVVVHQDQTTDDPMIVAHAPESFEDTDRDTHAADGTSPAEQWGLKPEGDTPDQGKLNSELVEEASTVRRSGVFASSMLGDPGKATDVVTSGGAEVGSEEDAKDQQVFAKAQREADEAAAKRREETSAEVLAATQGQIEGARAAVRGTQVDPTAKPSAKSGARAGGA